MSILRRLGNAARDSVRGVRGLEGELDRVRLALGRIEARQCAASESRLLAEHEFQVFSQNGEDGILQLLTRHVPIERRFFVEFGVEDYRECNTRFLLQKDDWQGIVIDGSPEHVATIRASELHWRHGLTAVQALVTSENIDGLLAKGDAVGDLGLLSIDIDGNDYWVWRAITVARPRIVVCEYNSLFGRERAVTIPYDPAFARSSAHHSNVYYGASIGALGHLARERGYRLVGSNRAGNNAFFVRDDLGGGLPALEPRDAWVQASFRESRDAAGTLTHLDPDRCRALIHDLPLEDVTSGARLRVADL